MIALLASDIHVAQNVAFAIIAVMMLGAAIRVVSTSNVVHAVLWLIVVLGGVAAQYILAAAEFVAVSQVMVYIGAVMVLFLFGVMLTRATIGSESNLNNRNWAVGIPVAGLLFATLAWVVIAEYGDETIPTRDAPFSTTEISDFYLGDGLIPFLALSFVLLAAAVGAIVLARKD